MRLELGSVDRVRCIERRAWIERLGAADDTMEPVSVTQKLTASAAPTVISQPGALQWVGLSGAFPEGQGPSYDADGNLRFDGRWTMTWCKLPLAWDSLK
jgi:hypothetical protein